MDLNDIRNARLRIRDALQPTPSMRALRLQQICGCELFLKLENLQMTGSFKVRGALNRMLLLTESESAAGVIAASAGNHAQGVAFAAQRLGIPACIVMPETAPLAKVQGTRAFGAEIVLHGSAYDAAFGMARQLQEQRGATFIHAFDDPGVMAGQGTIGLELLEQIEGFDIVVVPVGGGGLIAGVAAAVKGIRPDVRVVGVQSARVPAMRVSWEAGEIRSLPSANTIADGISVARVGVHTFPHCQRYVDDIVTVTDDEIAQAIMTLLEQEKLLAEGAGAVGVAALINGHIDGVSGKRVAVIVSGGNIDMIDLTKFLERGLAQDGRLANLRVIAPDKPGSVADVARIIAEHCANILQISQNRHAAEVGVREAEVELTLETRGHAHVNEIIGALTGRGYVVRS